jgi:hypothetical protein
MSPEHFLRHFESMHAPMACAQYRFIKYVRNYVFRCYKGSLNYDVLVEMYLDPSVRQSILPDTVLRAFTDDRAFFMDPQRIGGSVEESLVYGPPRLTDVPPRSKLCIFTRGNGDAMSAFLSHVARDARIERITSDRFTEEESARPFGTLLWLLGYAPFDAIVAKFRRRREVLAIIEAKSHETAPALLKALAW